jgi:putative membrane protein
MMLAFWGALIAGAILLVRWLSRGGSMPGAHEDPLAILQQRYAQGEVDEETYRRMRRELVAPSTEPETGDPLHRDT